MSYAALTGGLVVTPATAQLTSTNNATGVVFTVSTAAGCVGVTNAGTVAIQLRNSLTGSTPDASVTVTTSVVATTSALTASGVTITCAKSGSVYTPGPAQTVNVTSAAYGGTPFTIDTTSNPPPAWLTVTPTTGGTASSTPVPLSVVAATGCGGFATGTSNVATLHLLNAPAPDKLLQVTLQVVPPSPLSVSPAPASLTYVKGSGSAGYVDVRVTASVTPAPFFAVNTATLPIWLTVDNTTGSVPKNLRFSTTSVCETLAPGTYNATVFLKVSGYADMAVPVTLLVTNKAPKLSVSEGIQHNLNWTFGSPSPTPVITAVSTDSPIPYTVTTGGTLAPVVQTTSGLAYAFGTAIPVSFNPLVFAAATPGSTLTGTVTLTWGTPASTIVVTFNVSIVSPGAALSGLTPASLPTAAPGQTFTVVLTGTGFVPSADLTQKTKVGILSGSTLINDTNLSANVVNPSNIILTITVPASTDVNLPFSLTGNGGLVTLGVCNPGGSTCSTPTGTATLVIGSGPIVQAVTNAAAFVQVTPPALPTIAPYDIISVFGANFCSSGGTGCSSAQILYGTPDSNLRFSGSLSPDAAGATQRALSVSFMNHGSTTVFATAPLFFATNSQINLLVPAALSTHIGAGAVDMAVNFGYGSGATMSKSVPFQVNVAAADPGLFTVGADGQGDGAILKPDYSIVGSANPAGMRAVAADSDIIQIYLTGLGVPDSTGDNSTAGTSSSYPADCASISSYLTSLNGLLGSSLTNLAAPRSRGRPSTPTASFPAW